MNSRGRLWGRLGFCVMLVASTAVATPSVAGNGPAPAPGAGDVVDGAPDGLMDAPGEPSSSMTVALSSGVGVLAAGAGLVMGTGAFIAGSVTTATAGNLAASNGLISWHAVSAWAPLVVLAMFPLPILGAVICAGLSGAFASSMLQGGGPIKSVVAGAGTAAVVLAGALAGAAGGVALAAGLGGAFAATMVSGPQLSRPDGFLVVTAVAGVPLAILGGLVGAAGGAAGGGALAGAGLFDDWATTVLQGGNDE